MVNVVKWDGRSEPFQREKVSRTLIHLGASPKLAEEIAGRIELEAREGMTTKEIMDEIRSSLKEHGTSVTPRRDLRTALGLIRSFPDFEEYVRIVLSEHGYEVSPNQVIQGFCVSHEIDGIARRDGETIYLEVKNHSDIHSYTPFEVTLSAKAKWDDMTEGFKKDLNKQKFDRVLIVCNTRLTDHARKYAECIGLSHLGWNVPEGRGLDKLIEDKRLYPITMLQGLSGKEADKLSEKGILTLKKLIESDSEKAGIGAQRIADLVSQAERILEIPQEQRQPTNTS